VGLIRGRVKPQIIRLVFTAMPEGDELTLFLIISWQRECNTVRARLKIIRLVIPTSLLSIKD
jgi:hypothetical protein